MLYDLVIRTVSKGDTPLHSHRGDVIEVMPAGHPWTFEECTNDFWRIVRVDLLETAVAILKAHTLDVGVHPSRHKRREWHLDLDRMPQPERFTGKRVDEVIELTRNEFMHAVVRKK